MCYAPLVGQSPADDRKATDRQTACRGAPSRTAPRVSTTDATTQAWRSVRTPEPTDVPNVLATSFAPMPMASTNAMTKPTTTIHITSLSTYTITACDRDTRWWYCWCYGLSEHLVHQSTWLSSTTSAAQADTLFTFVHCTMYINNSLQCFDAAG